MAYGTPTDPVGGTVITVAYAVSNLLNPIRWLRLMTGNADPPGSSYVVVSDSVSGTTWRKIPTDAIADLAITPAKLDRAYLALIGGTLSGNLTISLTATPTQGYLILGSSTANYIGFDGSKHVVVTPALHVQNDLYVYRALASTTGFVIFGTNPANYIGFNGTDYACGAGALIHGGNIGSQAVASATNAGNVTTSIGGVALAGYNAPTATNAAQVGGLTPTATPAAGAIPKADASGKLDSWVTLSGGGASVPTGLIAAFATASAIATGWARYAAANGRLLVGDDNGTGVVQENHSYGTTGSTGWQHLHTLSSVPVTVTSLSVAGSATGGPSDFTGASATTLNGRFTAGGANSLPDNHTHPLNGVSLTVAAGGTGAGTATGSTTNTTWMPPMWGICYAQKT